ncbi:MAG: hypothetical protein H0T46_37820 [Deltaproteobacteria bacterium]|nr:hypothetical protein [Deltaproteobacteria bacterium]
MTTSQYCGDGTANGSGGNTEACDGADLKSQTCTLQVPGSTGTLGCNTNCSFNTDACVVPTCGDGIKNLSEECDGTDFGLATCNSKDPGTVGNLICNAPGGANECKISATGCTAPPPTCGDDVKNGAEVCDNTDFGTATCASIRGTGSFGPLNCNGACSMINTNMCSDPYSCGDGIVTGTEQCDDDGTTGGNGCSATCMVEAGYYCSGAPSTCMTVCGDGVRAGAEACDPPVSGATTGQCGAGCMIVP